MEAVTLTNISKRYGSVEALRGVSLSVAPREVFGIIRAGRCGQDIAFPHPHHFAACRRRLGLGLRSGCGEGLQSHPQAGGVYARTASPSIRT